MLTLKDFAANFIDQIINVCDLSFLAVYQLTPNAQDMDYVEELKANLIEMYSCMVFSLNNTKINRKLFDHFGNLATFIVRTCDKDVHPTVVILPFISGISQELPLFTPWFSGLLLGRLSTRGQREDQRNHRVKRSGITCSTDKKVWRQKRYQRTHWFYRFEENDVMFRTVSYRKIMLLLILLIRSF